MENGKWPGTWKVVCDVCGFWFASDKIKDRWDGLKVCHKDWEIKHPQLTIKVFPETIVPPFSRPEPTDVFAPYCTLITNQAIPGFAGPGCMIPSRDNSLPNQSI